MTQEQNTNGGKNDKRTKNNPSPSHIYAESMLYAIAILELILWHKYKTRKKGKCKHSSIDQAP